ncbi:exocyst complex component 2-like [Watersipora subatra]|uniref:exocyst complex component 2-like n=1 Tax=Watersipora subatra TaxID=2589382 RepID=UPI00355C4A2D
MPPPFISGVSPSQAPWGTLITIRGENLGTDEKDVISLLICNIEMVLTVDWVSKNKVTARAPQTFEEGDIILTTKSGGASSSGITFKGMAQAKVLPHQESTVFVDETHSFKTVWDKHGVTSEERASDNLLSLSDEGVSSKDRFPFQQLPVLFPGCNGDVTTAEFNPYWYLLERHSGASFEDLKVGLSHLTTKMTCSSKEPMSFVKTNLSTFMECQDALVTMHNKLTIDENQKEMCLDKLNMLLQAADRDSDSLFHDIIRRKEKADATRNALGILGRFKFLFYLPPTIRANIAKGDYDVVINDYTRAKLLFKDTEVGVFKEFYAEVEKEVQKFRESLHNKLLQMPSSLEDKKRIIRHLVDLEYVGNPTWECINRQNSWLLGVLSACLNENANREHDECSYSKGRRSRSSKPSISLTLNTSKDSKGQLLGPASAHSDSPKVKTPQRVIFVEELTDLLIQHFPSFYRLGHAYFEGQLLRKDRDDSYKAKAEQKQNHQIFKQMIHELLLTYCNLVRRAFLPESLQSYSEHKQLEYGDWTLSKSELPSAWLPQCVRTVRQCAESLRNDLPVDSESSNLLQTLVFDLRTDAMRTILKQAIDDVHKLNTRETWILDTNDSSGSTTQLPALFEHCINEAISHLDDIIIIVKQGELDIFNDKGTQEQATALCIDLVKAYVQALEKCAFEDPASMDPQPNDSILDTSSKLLDEAPPVRRRLIITLSNCHYSLAKIMPRLVETLDKHGYHGTNKVMQFAEEHFEVLDEKLFNQYIELKVEPILGGLEDRMYAGKFDWATSREPLAVRDYIKDSITQIVEAHAEVYSVLSTDFIPKVMAHIVNVIAEEINRLIFSITKFNKNGALQARIDLLAFRLAVKNCLTKASTKFVDEALERLVRLTKPSQVDEAKIERIISKFQHQFKFHLLAFRQVVVPPNA